MDVGKLREVLRLLGAWKMPQPWWETMGYNEYQIMLAIVLSNRTSYRKVKKFIDDFTQRCTSFECIASKTAEELQAELKPLGLAKMRVKLLKGLACKIQETGGLESFLNLAPGRARELLLQVSGIGSKTADMVMTALFRQHYFIVDTHILRIMKRVGVLEPAVNSLYEARALLEPHIPEEHRLDKAKDIGYF